MVRLDRVHETEWGVPVVQWLEHNPFTVGTRIRFPSGIVEKSKRDVSKTTISFGRSESMAIDSVNRSIGENIRISNVFPWI